MFNKTKVSVQSYFALEPLVKVIKHRGKSLLLDISQNIHAQNATNIIGINKIIIVVIDGSLN